MGAASISAVVEGRSSLWAGRAGRTSESRAQAVAVQRDIRSQGGPLPGSAKGPVSPHPVDLEPPSRGAVTPERAAVVAEQKAMAALAARCVAGDGAAWEELARSQHRRIYGICYRFIGSASEAEDLTQDVFIKVFRNIESFDPAKGGFNTWLTTLTRNMLVDNY